MQRWFFADELEVCERAPSPVVEVDTPVPLTPAASGNFQRYWDFCVRLPPTWQLWPNECLAIVGGCESLGQWAFERCVRMTRHEQKANMWRALDVRIPRYHHTEYRYLIMAVDEQSQQQIVRRWETAKEPRIVPPDVVGRPPVLQHCRDIFGCAPDSDVPLAVDRGWLTSETIVQFKFYNAPFTFQKGVPARRLHVRLTPMRLLDSAQSTPCTQRDVTYLPLQGYGGGGGDEVEAAWSTAFAFNEAAQLRPECATLERQPRYGNECGPCDLLLVHCTVGDFERTAYRIDLYTYSGKAAADEPPYAFGYQHVLPTVLGPLASGRLRLTVLCATRHRPVGEMAVEYLVVRPAEPPLSLPMNCSYGRRWQSRYTGLDAGHRGCGKTYGGAEGVVRENTIHSLQLAAASGADLIELDVQVTRDLVPVLHHDFAICVSQRAPRTPTCPRDLASRTVAALPYDDVRLLRTTPLGEFTYWYDECLPDGETAEQQPFPLLADALQAIDAYVGFNIEVKWPQELRQRGCWEADVPADVDKNRAMDAILATVWQHAGARRIVFSSFDADTCTLLRYKQHRYPVMLLFAGETPERVAYADPRCATLAAAASNALAHELLGIVSGAAELLEDPRRVRLVRSLGLVLFCYGDEVDSRDVIDSLQTLGLHAIIYDRIDRLIGKALPRSRFLDAATPERPCKYQPKSAIDVDAEAKCPLLHEP